MTEINVKIGDDKSFTVGTVVCMAGENKAVKLNFGMPESLRDYSKYVEYKLNGGVPAMSAEVLPGTVEFSEFLLKEVLGKGSLLVQVTCRKGEEVWKSFTKLLLVNESINATEYIVDTGKDILADLSDRLAAMYALVGDANAILDEI